MASFGGNILKLEKRHFFSINKNKFETLQILILSTLLKMAHAISHSSNPPGLTHMLPHLLLDGALLVEVLDAQVSLLGDVVYSVQDVEPSGEAGAHLGELVGGTS